MAAVGQFEQCASPAAGAGCGGSVPACRTRRPRPGWPAAGSGSSAAPPRCSRRGRPGPARCRSSPRRPSPRRRGARARRCGRSVLAKASRVRAMLCTDTSSTKTCGASTTAPATASGKRAACSSAIEPPSLWPNSQGGSVDAQRAQQRRQQLVRLAVHEVHAPALVRRARRRAAVAGARIHQAAASRPHRTAAAESRATSSASPGPRAGTPAAAGRRARGRAIRARCARAAAPVELDELDRHAGFVSCSRSLKRWILPVAVFGSSATNSICRGYL